MTSIELPLSTGPLVVPRQAPSGPPLKLSLIVPTYNECGNVQPLVEQVSDVLDEIIPGAYEIIFVDDNSQDGTAEKVRETAIAHPQTKLVQRTNERGLATAVIRGWQ